MPERLGLLRKFDRRELTCSDVIHINGFPFVIMKAQHGQTVYNHFIILLKISKINNDPYSCRIDFMHPANLCITLGSGISVMSLVYTYCVYPALASRPKLTQSQMQGFRNVEYTIVVDIDSFRLDYRFTLSMRQSNIALCRGFKIHVMDLALDMSAILKAGR